MNITQVKAQWPQVNIQYDSCLYSPCLPLAANASQFIGKDVGEVDGQ